MISIELMEKSQMKLNELIPNGGEEMCVFTLPRAEPG